MPFTSYKGTPFAPWLLPIIPKAAHLTKNSKICEDKLGKIPGQKWPSGWSGFGDWTRIKVGEGALVIWDSWYPKDHWTIGLQNRLFPFFDLDVEEDWQAEIAQGVVFEICGKTIIRGRSDGSPRKGLLYRLEQPGDFIVKNRREYAGYEIPKFAIEVLGKGQQCLIEGNHPKGGTYTWDVHPLEYGFDNLPRISPSKVYDVIKALDKEFEWAQIKPVRPKQLRGGDTGGGLGATEIGPNHPEVAPNPDELRRMLDFIPVTLPEFEGYDEWERASRALKTAGGGTEEFYEEVYLPWQQDGDNEVDYVRPKWESHTDSKLGWNYLCNIAGRYGYVGSTDGLFEPLDDDETPAGKPSADQQRPGHRGPMPKLMPLDFALHALPRRPFVLGHRFMASTVTLGVGAPGTGKSNMSILTALAIATGQPLTDEEVHRTGPVWIHNNEDSRDELYRRIGGMLKCRGIDLNEFHQNIFVTSGQDDRLIIAGKQGDIVKPTNFVAPMIGLIQERRIVHLVIDPLVSTHRGISENSNEDIEQVIEIYQRVAHETGCSIDLIHHSLKSLSGNTEVHAGNMNAARGASSLVGAARMVYTLAPMSTDTAKMMKLTPAQAARMMRLDHGKGNYTPRETNTRWFKLEPFDIGNGSCNFETDAPPFPGDTIAVPKPWKPPAEKVKATKAVQKSGKLQEVRNLVAGAMSADRCKLTDLLSAIGQAFDLKSSAARARLMDAIPEGAEVTAEAAEQIYLLKLDRVKPVPPGKLYVLRRIFDQEAEAA